MAITVKDIQEKEFSIVNESGYDMEQVDDFLDELADQLGAMMRENLALNGQVQELSGQVQELKESLASAAAANVEMEKKLPDYNENGYFRNLESAMRESLIGAQRIADETVAEASKKAQQTIDDANAQAEKTLADADASAKSITENAKQTVSDLTAETERLRSVIDSYKASFRKLVDEQLSALNNSEA